MDAIVAFLKTLTDRRYEHLLPKEDGQTAMPLPSPFQALRRKRLEFGENRVTHLRRADLTATVGHDVGGADALVQYIGDRRLELGGFIHHVERVAQAHGEGRDHGDRVGNALAA